MECPAFIQLIRVAEAARSELRLNQNQPTGSDSALLATPSWERALRTTIFTAEIDAAYHRARCPRCQGTLMDQSPVSQLAA